MRRDILLALRHGERGAGDLGAPFDISQPAISHHLKVLTRAGLVERRVAGNRRLFRLAPRRLEETCAWLDELRAGQDTCREARRMTLEYTLDGDTGVVFARRFAAPPAAVFDAHVDPALLRRWLYGPDEWRMTRCECDARPGGRFHYAWEGPDGGGFYITGEFVWLDRPRRIEHIERMHLPDPTPDNRVVTVFDPDGDATRMTMTMGGAVEGGARRGARDRHGGRHGDELRKARQPGPDDGLDRQLHDLRTDAARPDLHHRHADRQPEPPRPGRAGIEVENAAGPLDPGPVRVAGDDRPDPRLRRVAVELLAVVQHQDLLPGELDSDLLGIHARPVRRIHVASDRGDRRDPRQRLDDSGPADVAGMDDVIGPGESLDRLGPEEAVGVGDDADPQRLSPDRAGRAAAAPRERYSAAGRRSS